MPGSAIALVLAGALMHAGWNALLKRRSASIPGGGGVVLWSGLLCALAVPLLPWPQAAGWPYLLLSAVVHVLYFDLVAVAYRGGGIGFVYPLMRGSAPLLAALAVWAAGGEGVGGMEGLAVCLLAGGILVLALEAGRHGFSSPRAARAVVLNVPLIAGYTVLDGYGVRAAGSAAAYITWLMLLTALLFALRTAWREGGAALASAMTTAPLSAALGGCLVAGSYGVSLYAMQTQPIALVAALRETSVIFGVLIGVLAFGERLRWVQGVAVVLVVCGAGLMQLVGHG